MTRLLAPYASRTGTKKTLAALREAGWRILVSARGEHRHEGFNYCLDNGAWTAHQKREPFCVPSFTKALDKLGKGADFVVVPDIVGAGHYSLDFTLEWLPRVLRMSRVALIAVQDGLEHKDVADLLGHRVGVFVGGSTPWKLATLDGWCRLATEKGAWSHVGRVNSQRRIRLCRRAYSIDGTSVSQFPSTLPRLNRAVEAENWRRVTQESWYR